MNIGQLNESIKELLNETKEYPKMLTSLLRKCWYDGNGRSARLGKWYVGLGGYDTGYEVYFNNIPIFAISGDDLKMYQDEHSLIRRCGYNFTQILNAVKAVEPNVEISNWADFFEDDSEEFVLTDEDKTYLSASGVLDARHIEDELNQIEQAANVTTFTQYEGNKPLTRDEVIDRLGRETFLDGLARSAFHWNTEVEGICFDSSKLFESKNMEKSNKDTLQEFYDVEPDTAIEMEIKSLGTDENGIETLELDGIQFCRAEDEELSNAVDICIEEEFMPEWEENGIVSYSVDAITYDEETGTGIAHIGLFGEE